MMKRMGPSAYWLAGLWKERSHKVIFRPLPRRTAHRMPFWHLWQSFATLTKYSEIPVIRDEIPWISVGLRNQVDGRPIAIQMDSTG